MEEWEEKSCVPQWRGASMILLRPRLVSSGGADIFNALVSQLLQYIFGAAVARRAAVRALMLGRVRRGRSAAERTGGGVRGDTHGVSGGRSGGKRRGRGRRRDRGMFGGVAARGGERRTPARHSVRLQLFRRTLGVDRGGGQRVLLSGNRSLSLSLSSVPLSWVGRARRGRERGARGATATRRATAQRGGRMELLLRRTGRGIVDSAIHMRMLRNVCLCLGWDHCMPGLHLNRFAG